MKVLGLALWKDDINLIDCETGEVLAEDDFAVYTYLKVRDYIIYIFLYYLNIKVCIHLIGL